MTDYAALAAQFGGQPDAPQQDYSALAQQFGGQPVQQPVVNKLGADAFPDFLKQELANADFGTKNIAGFGTALSNAWEGLKQFAGQADPQQIEANKIIAQEAPVGAIAGNAAMTAIPFGLAGNSIKAAGAVGAAVGALEPVQGDQSLENIASGKLKNAAIGGALAAGGQLVANKAGDYVSKKLADLAQQKEANAPLTQTLNDALDAGLVVPPTSVKPSLANQLKESIGGKIATAQTASNRNAAVIDDLARKAVGLPANAPLEPAALQAIRDQAYSAGYKPIADMPVIAGDNHLVEALSKLSPSSAGGAVQSPAQAEISQLSTALANQGQWSGEQLIGDIQKLREISRASYSAASRAGGDVGKSDLARFAGKAADQLEQLAERNIIQQGGSPGAVQALRDARKLIAKTHTVEDALVEGGATVDARKLAAMVQNGKPLTDELAIIGKFANNYKKAVQPASQVGGPAVSALRTAMATPTAVLGSMAGGVPTGLALAGAQVAAPYALRSYMLSKGSQNALRDIYQLGLAPRVANGLLQYAPVGGTVLGLNALGQ